MVLFNPMVSFGTTGVGVNRVFHGRLPLSTLLLCSSYQVTKAKIVQHHALCLLRVAVVCLVRKRNLSCSAKKSNPINNNKKTPKLDSCRNVFTTIIKDKPKKMCPLHSSSDPESLLESYKSYYSSGSKNYYRDALFVLGPMGSGKTTVIRDKILTHKIYGNYAYVDTDELMEQLPGFDKLHVDHFYPTARQVAIKLTDWLLDNQLSFVAEGTCVKYQELLDYMIRLKRKGYSIKVCKLVKVDLDLVLKRSAKRETRKIDIETVKDIYIQSTHGLEELYSTNKENTIFEDIDAEML